MPHSRIVPALLCVALAHAAVIGAFLATTQVPRPQPIQSAAITARLLRAEVGGAPRTIEPAQPAATPPSAPAHGVHPRDAHMGQSSARHFAPPPAQPSSAAPPRTEAPRAALPRAAAEDNQSTERAHPPVSVQSAPAQPPTAAATSGATQNQAWGARSEASETMALAATKRAEHADCRIAKPVYPPLSKRRGESGTATVRFVIGTTGAIDSIALAKSSGFARLDDAALEALRESTCRPYLQNGLPIRVSYVQAFTFGLEDD